MKALFMNDRARELTTGGAIMLRISATIMAVIFVSILCLPSLSLGRKGGGSDDDHAGGHHHAGWDVPDQEERRKNPVPADQGSLEEGKKLYATYCASCHGAQGRGDGPAGAGLTTRPSDLTHHAGRHRDGEIAWKIANGRPPMPAWKNTLTETQIWHVVNYLKSIGSRGSRGGHDDRGHHR